MNYVGCKADSGATSETISPEFYMNYVGCKVGKLKMRMLLQKQVLSELCGM